MHWRILFNCLVSVSLGIFIYEMQSLDMSATKKRLGFPAKTHKGGVDLTLAQPSCSDATVSKNMQKQNIISWILLRFFITFYYVAFSKYFF